MLPNTSFSFAWLVLAEGGPRPGWLTFPEDLVFASPRALQLSVLSNQLSVSI